MQYLTLTQAVLVLALAATQNTSRSAAGNYASVNGLKMYYEVHGTGQPLVMLHGGIGGIHMFGSNVAELAKARKVVAVELQAHGRTADIDRPLRFELMADDIAALINQLGIGPADVIGYSLGGGVALQTAIRHPGAVRKLVVVSAPFQRSALYPEVLAAMAQFGPSAAEHMKESPLHKLYPDVNWPGLFTKVGDLLRQDYDWSKEVAAIKAPTMIVFADADDVRTTHIADFFRLLGGGQKDAGFDGSGRPVNQLAVLPGLTHYNISTSPLLATVVTPFLDAPMPGSKR